MKHLIRTIIFILVLMSLLPAVVTAADDSGGAGPSISFEDGSVYPFDLTDTEREPGKLILYTRNYGEATGPFAGEVREYVIVNGIVAQESNGGTAGTYIPPNGFVVCYTGSDAELLKHLETGSEVMLNGVSLPAVPDMYFVLEDMLVPIDRTNGLRDANQVVLYDPTFGESTKTNIWGLELTVVGNRVTRVARLSDSSDKPSESDSPIPADGVVISIHMGSPYYKQLNERAKAGASIKVSADARLYNASKISYAAYNPRTIAENPGAWDPVKKKPYDSFRGPNQLIIYDSSYGETTGTNPYGYEVTVNGQGIITASGGNDSEISGDGYILSGHGDSLSWLEKYASLGARVTLNRDKKTVTIILTPESYLNMARLSIDAARSSLEQARRQQLDIRYDKCLETIELAEARLSSLEEQVASGLYEGMTKAAAEIRGIADEAYYLTFESMRVENRAVWLRPRDTSIEQICKRLDMLKELNINQLYLETYWGGYSIYPTTDDLLRQNPMFNGIDILEVYLKEAHARGIEVHAWVENFLVGPPIADKKPEWMAVSRKGDTWYLENGTTKYHFLNPALPEVRDFLSDMYKQLVRKYNIDGIQFDYMRYSNSGDYTNDFGYDSYTRQLYCSYSGTDPLELKPGDPLWEDWCDFRTEIISSYAYRIISELKSLKPGLNVSADVWPEYDETVRDIYQDPRAWVRKGYINTLIPMSYYLNEGAVVEDIEKTLPFTRGNAQITSGIASFNKVDPGVFLKQVQGIRSSNIKGISIFEFESLFNRGYSKVLKPGAFSTPALPTGSDPAKAVRLLVEESLDKLDRLYVANGAMTGEQAGEYRTALSALGSSAVDGFADMEKAVSLKAAAEELVLRLAKDESLREEVRDRIIYDLNSVLSVIDGFLIDSRFISDHKAVRFQLELSLKELEAKGRAPYKVRAVFSDGAVMYLDRTQYNIRVGSPSSVPLTGDSLDIAAYGSPSIIILDVPDRFPFGSIELADKKAAFWINYMGKDIFDPYYGVLRVQDTGYSRVRLDWGGTVANTDIAGYILYCNGQELARTRWERFSVEDLNPGETYEFSLKAFDITGAVIYESNKVTVRTRELPLLAK